MIDGLLITIVGMSLIKMNGRHFIYIYIVMKQVDTNDGITLKYAAFLSFVALVKTTIPCLESNIWKREYF